MRKVIRFVLAIALTLVVVKVFNKSHAQVQKESFDKNYSPQNVRLIKDLFK